MVSVIELNNKIIIGGVELHYILSFLQIFKVTEEDQDLIANSNILYLKYLNEISIVFNISLLSRSPIPGIFRVFCKKKAT